MDWTAKDIQLYEQSKEYIDTAVIPLIPLSLGADIGSVVQKGEFISVLSRELEREYRGRILLLPPFTYISGQKETEIKRLQQWTDMAVHNGLLHVVYLTSDYEWKDIPELPGTTFWLPALPIGQLDQKAKRDVLQSQIREIMTILTEKWENVE
ncbi:MAG: YpiF family protein [Ectobacillus sp.]